MTQAENGDKVKVNYTGKISDGSVFDSTDEAEPLEFIIGDGNIIPAFEQSLIGMSPNDKKTIRIVDKEAYGPHIEELVQVIDRAEIPDDVKFEVGQRILVGASEDDAVEFIVLDINEKEVVLDANHPLAGQDLTFDITLLEVIKKKEQA
ncbi:MAG: FKBP-type peptidyl-prolyl cis-trans isomerase [Candidatus Methanofastidiosia archaeon]